MGKRIELFGASISNKSAADLVALAERYRNDAADFERAGKNELAEFYRNSAACYERKAQRKIA